jgi:hypothetical protein
MTRRLRVLHVIVQPVLVWDDGEELEAGPQIAPASLPLPQLNALADRLRAEVAALEAQQESPGDAA